MLAMIRTSLPHSLQDVRNFEVRVKCQFEKISKVLTCLNSPYSYRLGTEYNVKLLVWVTRDAFVSATSSIAAG